MARKNIEALYDVLFTIRSNMEEICQDAEGLLNDVSEYGGELNRVVKEQLSKYFIPGLTKLIKDENTPGSIIGLIRFMDSLPLAMTRVEPSVENVAPVVPENPSIDRPVNSEVDTLPANASYANPATSTAPVQESMGEASRTELPFLNESAESLLEHVTVEDLYQELADISYAVPDKSEERDYFLIWYFDEKLASDILEDRGIPEELPDSEAIYDLEDFKNYTGGAEGYCVLPYYEDDNYRRLYVYAPSVLKESKKSKNKIEEFFNEEEWQKSEKGKEEREWWLHRVHAEDFNRWPRYTSESLDAESSLAKFGKIFVDDSTDRPIEKNYVQSLIKSWGEPLTEAQDSEVYQVVKDTDIHSSLGADVSNQEPTVVTEHDTEEEAKEKASELNQTVTAGEKSVLGTEYKVQKQELKESTGEMEESDIKNWVEETIDDWVRYYDDDEDSCEQAAEDLSNAQDYFLNNLNEFEDRYGYELDTDAEDLLRYVVEDYVNSTVNYLIDTHEYFSNLSDMMY